MLTPISALLVLAAPAFAGAQAPDQVAAPEQIGLSDVLRAPQIGMNGPLGLMQDTPPPGTDPIPTTEPAGEVDRGYLMEVNFRGRYMAVPEGILDIFYFNEDASPGHPPRPKIHGYTVGLEYAIRNESQMGVFYFDYGGSLIDDGYWDDIEEDESANFDDGDYVVMKNVGILVLGADYYYDMRLAPWFSIVVGGGLGGLMLLGDIRGYDGLYDGTPAWAAFEANDEVIDIDTCPDPNNPSSSTCETYQYRDQWDEYSQVPRFLPMIDINLGVKFHFNDRASLRLEGGFHNFLYGGGALGIVF